MLRSCVGSLVLCLSFASVGCRTSCSESVGDEPEAVEDGVVNDAATSYENVPWDGRYAFFPPNKRYDFYHHLRDTPVVVQPLLSFTPCPLSPPGTCEDDPNPAAEVAIGAGDISPIEASNKTFVRVRNRTCETFYLRVAALLGG